MLCMLTVLLCRAAQQLIDGFLCELLGSISCGMLTVLLCRAAQRL